MPELAEVAYASTRWKTGINQRIQDVIVHPKSRVYREHDRSSFIEELFGTILRTPKLTANKCCLVFLVIVG